MEGRQLEGVDLTFVDSLAVPASLHDVEGRFLRMNSGAERASGMSNAQMLGRQLTDLLHPQARENVRAYFRGAVESGEPADFVTAFVDASGHLRSVRALYVPLRSGDAIVGVLILAFDARLPPSEPIALRSSPHLTPRQLQVLELVASGLSTSEIAQELTLSIQTVRNHVRAIFRELGAHTRLEAILAAERLGLLASPPLGAHPLDENR